MKTSHLAHLFISLAVTCSVLVSSANAEEKGAEQAPPSVEQISKAQPGYKIKTITEYESSFLPGVRLCEESEVDYRGDFRKVNCQDEALINSVSTRQQDPYHTKSKSIVNDRIEPNGNILRIKFRRKTAVVPDTSDN